MLVEEVAEMEPIERFIYWIRERHQIFLRRSKGLPKPWTDDQVLQSNFFTNPYRENDKVTQWFREYIRDPLRDSSEVLFATVAFRWFNKPDPTGIILINEGLLTNWDEKKAVAKLNEAWDGGENAVFTGAYMIKAGNGPKGCKITNVCAAITNIWKHRQDLIDVCLRDCRLQALWAHLIEYPFLGKFMSYEIVCDLRYTRLLENATDVDTWANPGPGASRGLLRLEGGIPGLNSSGESRRNVKVDGQLAKMVALLAVVRKKLPRMPKFELREIEHDLCEYDKYERACDTYLGRPGGGLKMKRVYDGRG